MSGQRRGDPKEEANIELSVVLVDKSFDRGTQNEHVKLSLVSFVAKPSDTIASLKKTLRRFAQRTVLSLYYRGIRCSPARTVDYYRGLATTDAIWQARLTEDIAPNQPKIALDILIDPKKIVLMLPPALSIVSLKDIIHHRLGYPPEDQHLLVNNKSVRGTASLRDYSQRSVSTSMVLLHEAPCDEEASSKYIQFSRCLSERIHRAKRSEEWVHCEIVSGLNIEGICLTPSCRWFGQNAIYALGQSVFDMCIDAALCPYCKQQMHITNAGFHDCAWRIQGVKKNGEHLRTVNSISRETGDAYVRCDPAKCRTPGKWHRLMLQAVPLSHTKQCAICHSTIDSDDFVTSLCGEYLHSTCCEAWKKVDTRCPSCQQQLQMC